MPAHSSKERLFIFCLFVFENWLWIVGNYHHFFIIFLLCQVLVSNNSFFQYDFCFFTIFFIFIVIAVKETIGFYELISLRECVSSHTCSYQPSPGSGGTFEKWSHTLWCERVSTCAAL